MAYTLLIDSNEEVLQIQKIALEYFYGGEILTAKSASSAIEVLKENENPEMIIVDWAILQEDENSLYNYYVQNQIRGALILCSPSANEEIRAKYPASTTLVQKPVTVDVLTSLVRSTTHAPILAPTHIPIEPQLIVSETGLAYDLFLKLSESNYIKIVNAGETFAPEEAQKFLEKGIKSFYIRASDSRHFLSSYEAKLKENLKGVSQLKPEEGILLAMDSVEDLERMARRMGWTSEVVEAVQNSMKQVIGILSQNAELKDLLKQRLLKKTTYSGHIGLQAFLTCAFSTDLEANSESVQMKLAMASILHDMYVPEEYYQNIEEWNRKASDLNDKSPEVTKYRLHPFEASRFTHRLDIISPDIGQILLQHHERSNGTGFPRGLSSSRIGHLSSLFIIVEEFINFIQNREDFETAIKDFITWGDEQYQEASFQKIYKVMRMRLMA